MAKEFIRLTTETENNIYIRANMIKEIEQHIFYGKRSGTVGTAIFMIDDGLHGNPSIVVLENTEKVMKLIEEAEK